MRRSDEVAAVLDAMAAMGLGGAGGAPAACTGGACPDCGTPGRLLDGVVACPDCAAVLARHLDASPEWLRDGSEQLERCGPPVSELYPCGNGSYLVGRAGGVSRQVLRMQRWGGVSYAKRTLCRALSTLASEAKHLGLNEAVTTRAKHLYSGVAKSDHFRGTRRAGLVEGCILAALHAEGAPRAAAELPHDGGRSAATGIARVMRAVAAPSAPGSAPCATTRALVARKVEHLGDFAPAVLRAAEIVDDLALATWATPPTRAAACALLLMPAADADRVCAAMGCTRGTAARAVQRLKPYRDDVVTAAKKATSPCSGACGS